MISCMETQLGLMVIGPQGQYLRIPRGHPAFQSGRNVLHQQSMPAEQAWRLLNELMEKPLKALSAWVEKFGFLLQDKGPTILLRDKALDRDRWLPLLQKSMATGGSPAHALLLADRLGEHANKVDVGQLCVQLTPVRKAKGALIRAVIRLCSLPDAARVGDLVEGDPVGPKLCLVGYDDYTVTESGDLTFQKGRVLQEVLDESWARDVLAQPFILGNNLTYQCEEGSPDGWLTDLSFDSLAAARANAKEIVDFGREARIINRLTGDVVPVAA